MEWNKLDFSSLKNRLRFFSTSSPEDLLSTVNFFNHKISKRRLILTKDQKECLLSVIRLSSLAHQLFETQERLKENKLKAEYILLGKGASESKCRAALKLYGLDQSELKKKRLVHIKTLYESLYNMSPDSTTSDGVHEIDYQISRRDSRIRWRTQTEKKNGIISFIRSEFYSDSVTRNAVIMALRRVKTKHLPGIYTR